MMEAWATYSNGAYWLQQCVVFALWVGFFKLLCGELRALWGEEKRTRQNLPCGSELGRGTRESAAAGRRTASPSAWRIEAETLRRTRRQSEKRWRRVGISLNRK